MRLLLALLALFPALAAGAAAVDASDAAQARQWLELVDAGRYAQAWNQAAPALRGSGETALAQRLRDARGGTVAAKCRKDLSTAKRHGDASQRVVLFVTEFTDGRRVGEQVTLTADTQQVAGYRVGPPAGDRGAPCSSGTAAELQQP